MKLFSDEYMTLTNKMFDCLKMACKAAEYKAARKALKDAGKA